MGGSFPLMRPHLILPLLGLLAGTAAPAVGQEWIARVKSAPQEFQDRSFRIDGEVLELRGATAVSRQGLYRLSDGSDPIGVLVRTTDLPETSGPFQVTVKLAPELLYQGSLLLDEVRRQEPFVWQAVAPLVIAALGIVLLLLYGLRYGRARQRERHQHLAPPMWLIPTDREGGTGGSDPGGAQLPAVRFNYRLQYIEQERSEALEHTKRTSLRWVAGAGAITLASMAWFLIGVEESTGRPTFVLLAPVFEVLGPRPDSVPGEIPTDTATLTLAVPAPTSAATGAPRVRRPAARPGGDSLPRRTRPRTAPAPDQPAVQAPVQTPAVAETTARAAAPVAAQVPPPLPLPRPEPAARDTAPQVPQPPDPAALRHAGATVLQQGAEQAVAAMNRADLGELGALYAAGANASWRDRLFGHLRDYKPTAVLGDLDPPVLTEAGAQTAFPVTFRWRTNFGVYRSRTVRFAASARVEQTRWVLVAVRLLEPFP